MRTPTGRRDRSELLRAWRDDGDRVALDDLLRLELDPIKQTVRQRLHGYARTASRDTSDYVDEAVFRLLRLSTIPEFDDPKKLRAYLARAAVNLFVNHYHAAKRKPLRVTVEDLGALLADQPGDDADKRELADILQLSLNLLDETESELLRRHFVDGESIRDLAITYEIPKTTMTRRLEQAKSNLVMKMLRWRQWMSG